MVNLIRSRSFFALKQSIHEGGTIVSPTCNGDASMSSIRNAGAIMASSETIATPLRIDGFSIIFRVLFFFDTPLRQTCKPSLVNLFNLNWSVQHSREECLGVVPARLPKGGFSRAVRTRKGAFSQSHSQNARVPWRRTRGRVFCLGKSLSWKEKRCL